jgi:tetratricopeptide (TPR) repeat protein
VSRVANDLYTPIYVRRIGPGTADVVRYRFQVPDGAAGTLQLRATLRYRKFMLPFVENVAKIRGGKGLTIKYRTDKAFLVPGDEIDVDLGKLPIVDMASGRLELPITAEGTPGAPPAPETLALKLPDDRDRLNDLAIAYLIQGDPDQAIDAFQTITRVDPKYADGWVNVARALIARLHLDEALVPLREAQRLKPGYPKALFFEAEVWRLTARDFPRAEALYKKVLEAFPRDRESWKRLGQVQWDQDRFADGLATLEKYMKIEPEDSDAWYWVMRCYEGLGDAERAAQARTAHDKFRRDDEVTSRQGETLITDPNLHRLAQPIHVHVQPGLDE